MLINSLVIFIVATICLLQIVFEYVQYKKKVVDMKASMDNISQEMAEYESKSNESPLNDRYSQILRTTKQAELQKKINENKTV